MADVVRQMAGTAVEVLDVISRPLHLEHLVALADVYHQLVDHQVGPEGDLRRLKAPGDEEVLQQTGVQHDVTVVGNEEITCLPVQFFKSRAAELPDAAFYDTLVDHPHRLCLELAHGPVARNAPAHRFQRLVRIDVGSKERKGRTAGYAHHCSRNLLCIVRSNVIKTGFLHCCLCFIVL